MESGDLRVFQTVAREGSITKAAARLNYVQSNVTARIQQLESELGTVLFLRHNRGMTLTGSGRTLLDYADKILGLLDEAGKAVCASTAPRGRLTIGSMQTAAAVRMPKLLAAYHRQFPDVQLGLSTGHSQLLMEKVLHYELDGAFVGYGNSHPELASATAFEEELVLVSSPTIDDTEVAVTKPLLVYNIGCYYRSVLEQWLQSVGLTEPLVMEFGTIEAILGGVAANLGVSLLPRTVISKSAAEGLVRVHEIPAAYSRVNTYFVWRNDAFVSSALQAFIDLVSAGGHSTDHTKDTYPCGRVESVS